MSDDLWATMAGLGWLGVLVPEDARRPRPRAGGPGRAPRGAGHAALSGPVPVVGGRRHACRGPPRLRRAARRTWPRGAGAGPSPSKSPATGTRWRRSGPPPPRTRRRVDAGGGQAHRPRRGAVRTGRWWWRTTGPAWRRSSSTRRRVSPCPPSTSPARWPDWSSTAARARRVGPAGDQRALWGRVLDDVGVALCAEMVGTAERALELAVEYAKVRVQFGRPIATFQAIKHKAADMLHHVELARVGTHFAAWASDTDDARARAGGGDVQGVRRRGGRRGHRRGHPGARRRGLHLGRGLPPAVPPGQTGRPALRGPGLSARQAGRPHPGACSRGQPAPELGLSTLPVALRGSSSTRTRCAGAPCSRPGAPHRTPGCPRATPCAPAAEHHHGGHVLAEHGVGDAHHRRLDHVGMVVEHGSRRPERGCCCRRG